MISLDQIRELNDKVQSALKVIRSLREENTLLRGKLKDNEERVKELELLVSSFRNDQHEIEEGLKDILLQLGHFEEELTDLPLPGRKASQTGGKDDSPGVKEPQDGAVVEGMDTGASAETPSDYAPDGEKVSFPVRGGTAEFPAQPADKDDAKGGAPSSAPPSDKTSEADGSVDGEFSEISQPATGEGELGLF